MNERSRCRSRPACLPACIHISALQAGDETDLPTHICARPTDVEIAWLCRANQLRVARALLSKSRGISGIPALPTQANGCLAPSAALYMHAWALHYKLSVSVCALGGVQLAREAPLPLLMMSMLYSFLAWLLPKSG